VTRRELLTLSPLLLLGAFAVPSWRDRLLEAGMTWSDTASGRVFRRGHLAASHPEADVAPFEQFPYNGYDVLEPTIDFDRTDLAIPAHAPDSTAGIIGHQQRAVGQFGHAHRSSANARW